jgi:hypothetical protein
LLYQLSYRGMFLVPRTGVEPVCLAASDFKSDVYTNSTIQACKKRSYGLSQP